MGYRRFAPKLYYQLSLERLVPQNHLPAGSYGLMASLLFARRFNQRADQKAEA